MPLHPAPSGVRAAERIRELAPVLAERAADYDFDPSVEAASAVLARKTVASRAVPATAGKALEVAGGAGFYRSGALERFIRDPQAVRFHPLLEKRQLRFSGRVAPGLDPVG